MANLKQALSASIAATKRMPNAHALRALAHRDFRLLLAANMSNDIAMWALHIVLGWVVFEITDSPLQVGLLFSLRGVAILVVAPFGGALSDRINGRVLVSLASVIQVSASAVMAVLSFTDGLEAWHAHVMLFAVASAHGIGNPTRHAMVYDVAGKDDVSSAIAVNNIGTNTMRIMGPALSGILLGTVGVTGAIIMCGAIWVVPGLAVGMIRTVTGTRVAGGDRPPFLASLSEGLAYARRDFNVGMVLVVTFSFNVLAMSFQQLMSAYAGDVLGLDGQGFGLLMAGVGAGAIVGAVTLTMAGERMMRGYVLLASVGFTGAGIMTLAAGTLAATIPVLIIMGFAVALAGSISAVLVQTNTENRYRGRVTSLYLQAFGVPYLASLPVGALGSAIGLQTTFFIQGAIVVALTLWFATSARLRQLEAKR